jgi:hypothetical protein
MATEVVQQGVNGFCARDEEEWFVCLDRLVRDEDLRRRFSLAGRKTVEQKYSLEIWGPRLPALLDEILKLPARASEAREAVHVQG